MKKIFALLMLTTVLLYYGCDNFEDPAIPEINNCSLSLTNTEGIPLSNVWVKVYYSDIKPDFVVDSTFTSVLGKASLQSLEPREYTFKAFRTNGEELGITNIVVTNEDASNNVEWSLDVSIANYTFTIVVVDNKGNPISGRKVELLTRDGDNLITLKEGLSNTEGKVEFAKTVAGTYLVYVYDDDNLSVFDQAESTVGAAEKNTETFLVQKIFHSSDIVITGFVHDPRGSDSPKAGAVSGDGLVHPGQYEYVQLMALKDISFAENNYSIIFTNTTTPTEYGWAAGLYDETSKKVYQINLTTGSVKKGQYFYVGGSARAICSYYQLTLSPQLSADVFWGIDYAAQAGGNGNGAMKNGSGLMGNGTGKSQSSVTKSAPDGIAVFKGTNVDENTVPMDAVFYGTSVTYQAYQMPNNDIYSRTNSDTGEEQALFGEGSNTYLFPVGAQDLGTFIKLGGKVTPNEWLTPRSGAVFLFNMKDYPGASVADIENSADCTVFVDK
ncbi:hypothetical protein SAMN05444274_1022 [Mariniphaga anaerophila]|uniref:Uncharacterized protein n=1 Tax=Mariniphaga anaerophila TaxID=1484053 RepID=A0A1M4V677_9BACT|nr:Ig-like domain-containing protein [Mariniphaga anaerophila]SHE64439.1 hypothetical protein SAMN05444274_1022 [Mariniphaga anaerophila]